MIFKINGSAFAKAAVIVALTFVPATAMAKSDTKIENPRLTAWVARERLATRDGKSFIKRRHVQRAFHGNGSYICSPSGFGQKSRCFRR